MGRRGGEWLAAQLAERDPRLVPFRERLAPLIEDMVRETPFLEDIRGSLDFLTERPVVVPDREEWRVALASVLESLEPWDAENIEKVLRSFMKERGLKGREFFHPLRLTVTGRDRGASLPLILFTLGRGECAARLNP